MIMFVFVLITYFAFGFMEILKFKKLNQKKELKIYLVIISFSFAISTLLSFGVKLYSPVVLIEKLVNMFNF